MTIEPTREEWMAAQERVGRLAFDIAREGYAPSLTEAALGPCPPEPPPEPWRWGDSLTVDVVEQSAYVDGPQSYVELSVRMATYALPPDDAEEMGNALIERAQWLREHGDKPCPPPPEDVIARLAIWIEENHPGVQVYRDTGLVVT